MKFLLLSLSALLAISLAPLDRFEISHEVSNMAHIPLYAFFTILALNWRLRPMLVLPILNGLGLLMEICQKLFCTQRSFEWADVMLNMVGTLVGFLLFYGYARMQIFITNQLHQTTQRLRTAFLESAFG
jgi:VanZ family protein